MKSFMGAYTQLHNHGNNAYVGIRGLGSSSIPQKWAGTVTCNARLQNHPLRAQYEGIKSSWSLPKVKILIQYSIFILYHIV
jgi:hypothetical protein